MLSALTTFGSWEGEGGREGGGEKGEGGGRQEGERKGREAGRGREGVVIV